MKNITISIPTATWRKARMWAAEHEMSLSQATTAYFEIMYRVSKAESMRKHAAAAYRREAQERDAAQSAAESQSPSQAASLPPSPAPENQPNTSSNPTENEAKNACETVKTASTLEDSTACSHPAKSCEAVKL